jgi:iron complex outermembrane receptor protein
VSPAIDGWANRLGYYDSPLILTQGGTNKVIEKNLGYYLQGSGEVKLGAGDMRLAYDAGLRYVETRQRSAGYQSGVFVTVDRPTYRDWLPSANAALWFNDEVVLRAAAAKVMARPGLGDLSPGAGVDAFGYTVSFQNPNLNPTRATALDAAIEWYFAETSLLSLAVFWKKLDSFPIRQSTVGTYASTGLPRSAIQPLSPADVSGPGGEGTCGVPAGCWNISNLTNGPGATVKGLEAGFQVPFHSLFHELPIVLRDLGVLANYTYVDSKSDYDFFGNTVKERLIGLSNGSYNATLYYDDSIFSARVSLAYRSDYLNQGPNNQGNLWTYTEASTQVDFSSSYNVDKHLKLSFEGLNVTNTPFSQRVDVDGQRRALYSQYGRTFLLGARLNY